MYPFWHYLILASHWKIVVLPLKSLSLFYNCQTHPYIAYLFYYIFFNIFSEKRLTNTVKQSNKLNFFHFEPQPFHWLCSNLSKWCGLMYPHLNFPFGIEVLSHFGDSKTLLLFFSTWCDRGKERSQSENIILLHVSPQLKAWNYKPFLTIQSCFWDTTVQKFKFYGHSWV